MKIKCYCLAPALLAALAQTASAMCLGNLLPIYLKNPQGATNPGTALAGAQLALVRIVAVHPDRRPRTPWKETGTLELSRIESTGKSLPTTFTVPYQKRGEPVVDCETWDFVVPKPGERLLAFFRPVGKGWGIPELGASGVVSDAGRLSPAIRTSAQRLFRTRL